MSLPGFRTRGPDMLPLSELHYSSWVHKKDYFCLCMENMSNFGVKSCFLFKMERDSTVMCQAF